MKIRGGRARNDWDSTASMSLCTILMTVAGHKCRPIWHGDPVYGGPLTPVWMIFGPLWLFLHGNPLASCGSSKGFEIGD